MGAFALTEPGAGSDVSSLQTNALLEGDKYILNGSKCFITNTGQAETYVIFASDKGKGGTSAFIVEKGAPGLVRFLLPLENTPAHRDQAPKAGEFNWLPVRAA